MINKCIYFNNITIAPILLESNQYQHKNKDVHTNPC